MLDLQNIDCMELMAKYPDGYFDLAIVDPPYGINMDGGKYGIDGAAEAKTYTQKDWDKQAPDKAYFDELIRVSKNQIVWGANHFISKLPYDSPCWLVWDKDKVGGYFADCELAWTSFDTAVRRLKWTWHGFIQQNMKDKDVRIHPTQKPVKLYQWILEQYAKPTDKILDTHLGSGSIAIACHYLGFDLIASEIDKDYYEAALKRIKEQTIQLTLI